MLDISGRTTSLNCLLLSENPIHEPADFHIMVTAIASTHDWLFSLIPTGVKVTLPTLFYILRFALQLDPTETLTVYWQGT